MFGYLSVDKKSLSDGEKGLFQAFMCAVCKSTKALFGNTMRLAVGNDVTFFSVLFHSYLQKDVSLVKQRCFSHPIKKRDMLATSDLSDKLATANVLLVYYKMLDDLADRGKKIPQAVAKQYRKAKSLLPKVDETLKTNCHDLVRLERGGEKSLDKVCHPFANLTRQFAQDIVGEVSVEFADLCYNVGKWVYLVDALDDAEKDEKKGNYNALTFCLGDVKSNIDQIRFVFGATLNRIAMCYNDLNMTKYRCLLDSVFFGFIRQKTEQILKRYEKGEKS